MLYRHAVSQKSSSGPGTTRPERHTTACQHGDRVTGRRSAKSNDAVRALSFLVEQYLGPHARARRSDNPDFAEFTFDHRLDGVIAGERDDTGELFLLRVSDSTISHETVVPGVRWWDSPDVLDGL